MAEEIYHFHLDLHESIMYNDIDYKLSLSTLHLSFKDPYKLSVNFGDQQLAWGPISFPVHWSCGPVEFYNLLQPCQ